MSINKDGKNDKIRKSLFYSPRFSNWFRWVWSVSAKAIGERKLRNMMLMAQTKWRKCKFTMERSDGHHLYQMIKFSWFLEEQPDIMRYYIIKCEVSSTSYELFWLKMFNVNLIKPLTSSLRNIRDGGMS